MIKYISTISICAFLISPIFLCFSKNYFLLAAVILGNWIIFNFLTRYLENSYIEKETDSINIQEDFKHGWMIEHVNKSCKQLGIKNPPRLRVDYASNAWTCIIGNQFRSTLIISEDWYNKFQPEILKAIISHELGHLYYDHMSVKSFLNLFQRASQELGTVIDELINLVNLVFGWVPFLGLLVKIILLLLGVVGHLCIFIFVYILKAVSLVTTRHYEYAADKFSYKAGFHEEFLIFLHFLEKEAKEPFFNFEEHPVTSKRKKRLLKYMAKKDERYVDYDFNMLSDSYDNCYSQHRTG